MLLAPPDFADDYLDLIALQRLDPKQQLSSIRTLLKEADSRLYADFIGGRNITRLVKIRAWVVEQLLLKLWRLYVDDENMSLVAVGGFGRGDLQLKSDVDLLILYEGALDESSTRDFIQALWDIGLDIGHAVRTVDECEQISENDVTVLTNLLEGRFLTGYQALYESMRGRIHADDLWTGKSFFQAKYVEQQQRHAKCGGTAYHLEPNIKEGPGGLRDIHMVSWVAQRHFKVTSMHGLVDVGFLHPDEYISLQKGRRYLWKVRFALHHLAQRKEDRLLFDFQKPLAEIFAFEDDEESLGVEKFMQNYYRNAMQLERLNLRLLQLFKENILHGDQERKIIELSDHYQAVNNYLEIKQEDMFLHRPIVFFEMFLQLQQHEWLQGIRADTVRAMRQSLHVIDESFRSSPEIQQQFIKIFKQPKRIFSQLMRMNRLGLLGVYLPAFGKIVGRMQYDLFHMYTVDQHSLFVLRNMREIKKNTDVHPLAHGIINRYEKTYILYLSAIFHDIAKGRGGDHSELGAEEALDFANRHQLPEKDKELLVWLVKHHLIMSVVAQKQDISDPTVIQDFSQLMGDQQHLDALYILTIADITGTDPKLWNGFKDSLLRELYQRSTAELREEDTDVLEQKKQHAIAQLSDIPNNSIEDFWDATDQRFFDHSSKEQINQIITQAINQPDQALVMATDKHDDGFGIILYANDYKGLFYHVVQVFLSYQIQVVDARIYSSSDDKALDYFHCLGVYDDARLELLKTDIMTVLHKQAFDKAVAPQMSDSREKHFSIQANISFSQGRTDKETQLEIMCADRSGLLVHIAQLFLQLDISIHGAKIATFGNRVEDVFWISAQQAQLSKKLTNTLELKLASLLNDGQE